MCLYLVLVNINIHCVYIPIMVVSSGRSGSSKDWHEIFLRLEEILLSDPPWQTREEGVPEGNYKLHRKSRIAECGDFSF